MPAYLVSPRPLVPLYNLQGLYILTSYKSAIGIDFIIIYEDIRRPLYLGVQIVEPFWPLSDRILAL